MCQSLDNIGEMHHMLHAIELCAGHQKRITEDVMRLSDLQAGRFAIEDKPFSLRDLITSCMRVYQKEAADAGIRLFCSFSSSCEHWDELNGDAQRIA